ncbi:MAG: MEDS domain-containing protein [Methanosarcina sp.]
MAFTRASGENFKNDTRASGIDILGNLPWGTHLCLFYQTKEDLMDIVIPYFKSGIENSEFCIWVVSEPLSLEETTKALKQAIPDYHTYLKKGQMEIIPSISGYVKNENFDPQRVLKNWIEKINSVLEHGFDGLRFSGNSFWLETFWEDIVRYEEKVDTVIGKYRTIALCSYPLGKCDAVRTAKIVSNHQFALIKNEGTWEKIENSGRRRAEKAESKLQGALESLEGKIKARTSELENANKSLQENERRLAEAQKIAHVGSWDWNLLTGEIYWSEELFRILGLFPKKPTLTFREALKYIHPRDRAFVKNAIKKALDREPFQIDYRIFSLDGKARTVHTQGDVIFNENNIPVRFRGTIQDITERKRAEKAFERMQEMHIREIHHRIKNNLQVISSLLSLQAEKFGSEDVLEAFKESQNRISSMTLIHEELYKGDKTDTLDFADYLQKLAGNLLSSYSLQNGKINLKLDLEKIYLDMDIAIPLGIIVNELISNSLKHAFPNGKEGEISIVLKRILKQADGLPLDKKNSESKNISKASEKFHYILKVKDNGKGMPEELDFQNTNSLGFQLVNILVDQIDGCVELKRDEGTEFVIRFNNTENEITS